MKEAGYSVSKFEHFVSLGYFCGIASMLEEIGLREASGPFDWLISDFKGVIDAIENNFMDFLNIDFFYQSKFFHKRYMNALYHFEFYHDFNEYQPLRKQINKNREKYQRRIERF